MHPYGIAPRIQNSASRSKMSEIIHIQSALIINSGVTREGGGTDRPGWHPPGMTPEWNEYESDSDEQNKNKKSCQFFRRKYSEELTAYRRDGDDYSWRLINVMTTVEGW